MHKPFNEKIVLIGAGSAMFTCGVVSDLIRSRQKVELALVDIDPQALETAAKLSEKMIRASRAEIHLTANLERRTVLPGATVVITTIGVGGRRAWEQDVFIPRRFGLNYAVGDTTGPGGTSRALRMIPPMLEIARDIATLAPQANFINYANPMSPICRAIRKETGVEVVGLCIGTHETRHYLAQALGVPLEALSYSCAGINHLTWFYDIKVNGESAMPRLQRIASERLAATEELLSTGQPPHCGSPYDSSFDHPFSWQCLQWFNAYPAPQDRHVTEFFPQFFRHGIYYGKTLGINEFTFEGTISDGDQAYAEMRRDALDPAPLGADYFEKLSGEQEQVVDILQAVRRNEGKQFFANLPNQGQAPNLPMQAVIETPVIANGSGIRAINQAPLPPAAAGILATRFAWVEMVVEAAVEHSREKFIQALVLDGAAPTPHEAAALADALLSAQSQYLVGFQS